MAITNDLTSVLCWVSQMASSHISSFISQMAITSRLATVFWWSSGMASCFISSCISTYIKTGLIRRAQPALQKCTFDLEVEL